MGLLRGPVGRRHKGWGVLLCFHHLRPFCGRSGLARGGGNGGGPRSPVLQFFYIGGALCVARGVRPPAIGAGGRFFPRAWAVSCRVLASASHTGERAVAHVRAVSEPLAPVALSGPFFPPPSLYFDTTHVHEHRGVKYGPDVWRPLEDRVKDTAGSALCALAVAHVLRVGSRRLRRSSGRWSGAPPQSPSGRYLQVPWPWPW